MAPPSRGKAAYAGIEESAQLGWRTLDGDGNAIQNNQGSFPQDDSVFAAKLPFGDPMHPDVVALREHMEENNGIPGLTVIDGQAVLEDDELAKRAAAIFHRDGFVAVSRALVGDDLTRMQEASDKQVREMMALDPYRVGNRGSHRYSFGGASHTGHCSHVAEWAELLFDNEVTRRIMKHIFDSENYICRGGGGDFCLAGSVEYQGLHQDMGDPVGNADPNEEPALGIRDGPPPACTCNYAMQDLTPVNGPIRQVPGTHTHRAPGGRFNAPNVQDEPEWMKISTVLVPAGSCVMRDVRCWHGGTPNLSQEERCLPNAEFLAPWFWENMRHSMPREIYDKLSPHGQLTCRYIVADEDEHIPVGYRMNAEAKGGLEHAFHESDEASPLSYEEDSASIWSDFVARKTQASKL